jgi:hypothetical protein
VHYLQSQNGNIYRARPAGGSEQSDGHASEDSEDEEQPELERLQEVFEKDVGFMTEALGLYLPAERSRSQSYECD